MTDDELMRRAEEYMDATSRRGRVGGFSLDAPERLANALRQHANRQEVAKIEPTPHGRRYVVEGLFQAADGRTPNLRSVWFIRNREETPRLVTAYPLDP